MQHYNNLRAVPKDALKEIGFGKLKGKSDINPQWRYESMTREFGVCGIGWKYEIEKTWTQPANDEQVMVFVELKLFIKNCENWSDGIPAIGGDFLLEKDKNGLHGNDEAYKMATTDALGVAMKMLGVAADIYRGLANDSKYGKNTSTAQPHTSTPPVQQKLATHPPVKPQQGTSAKISEQQVKSLYTKATNLKLSHDKVHEILKAKYNIESAKDLLVPDFAYVMNHMNELAEVKA